MAKDFRCDCPITCAIDVVGDRWTLVIIKQMLLEGKKVFKDFAESNEAIATNILASRLKKLEELGIVRKTKKPGNLKSNYYLLTQKGLDLTPILVEMARWSDVHLRDIRPSIADVAEMEDLRKNSVAFSKILMDKYKDDLASLEASWNR